MRDPSLTLRMTLRVIARSFATKQSTRLKRILLDCFASARNDVKSAALSLAAQRHVKEDCGLPLAKFVNVVYTNRKGGYRDAKVKNSGETPGGGYLHLSQGKGLCPFAIVASLRLYTMTLRFVECYN